MWSDWDLSSEVWVQVLKKSMGPTWRNPRCAPLPLFFIPLHLAAQNANATMLDSKVQVHALGMGKLLVRRNPSSWGLYGAGLSYQPWSANLQTLVWEKDELLLWVSHSNIILTDTSGLLKSENLGSHLVWWRGPWRQSQKAQVSDSWLCIQEEQDRGQVPCLSTTPLSDCTMQAKIVSVHDMIIYKKKIWWECYKKASVISEFSSGTEYKVDIWKSIVFLMKHWKLK